MGDRKPLTARQVEALQAIAKLTKSAGWPPTVRELAVALGLAEVSSHYLIEKLRVAGAISRPPRGARAITVTPSGMAILRRCA